MARDSGPFASGFLLLGFRAALILFLAPKLFAQGGALVIYENGSPDMGSSYAGAGARAQDAATVFTNPAGMTRIDGHQMIIGTMAVITDFEFDVDGGRTVSDPPGQTDGGGRQSAFAPGLGSFMVFDLHEDLRAGLSITALSAAGVDYRSQWAGRTFVTSNSIIIANIEPALAYRAIDWLSVGAGLNITYTKFEQELKAGSASNAATIKISDADDWAFGGTFGVLLEPLESTRFGVTYRTEIDIHLSGSVDNPTPNRVDFDSDMTLAQGINLSAFHQLTERLAILGDVGWSDWSSFDRQPITVGPVTGGIDRDWRDTWRIGLGLQFQATENLLLSTGYSLDTSPVSDGNSLPDLPVGEQHRFSLGTQYDFGDGKVFGASYTFFYTDIDIDTAALPPSGSVILDGDFDRSYIHFLGLTLKVDFGKPRAVPSGGSDAGESGDEAPRSF